MPPVIRRLDHVVTKAQDGTRLADLVMAVAGPVLGRALRRGEARRLVMAGAVRLDGRPVRRPGLGLHCGTRVAVRIDTRKLTEPAPAPEGLQPTDVLYEDPWLIAVGKPPGLPTHVTADPSRPHLVGLVLGWLRARSAGPREGRLGVHQRLDRDTSGVVLLTKDPSADTGLARQFAAREIVKTYHALTMRPGVLPPTKWRVSAHIDTDAGPQDAVTDFERRESFPRALLVEARPRTGRKHQIRIHLASMGLAILGDDRHGPSAVRSRAPRLLLHATRLELRHPIDGRALRIECPWPADFERALEGLRAPAPVRKR